MSTPVGKEETFPALVAHSLSRLHCWHIASPPSLCRGNTGSLSRCCMDFMPVCLFFGCLPSDDFCQPVMLNLSISADSSLMRFCFPVPPLACSVPYATVYIVILAASPHFYFAKVGQASCCKGTFILASKKSQRFWGAVAPGPNSLRLAG